MAKALGQALALRTSRGILSIDGIDPAAGSYLDVGAPIGPALPVVIKTIVFSS
jgi:ethanolamine utilization protein EutA